jgi:hypothetical protein
MSSEVKKKNFKRVINAVLIPLSTLIIGGTIGGVIENYRHTKSVDRSVQTANLLINEQYELLLKTNLETKKITEANTRLRMKLTQIQGPYIDLIDYARHANEKTYQVLDVLNNEREPLADSDWTELNEHYQLMLERHPEISTIFLKPDSLRKIEELKKGKTK